MFNRKRVFVFAVFILLMFFMMTFAGSANRDNTPTRTVEFVDGFDKSVLSNQIIKLGEEAQVPTTPQHDECNFVGWFIEGDESRKIEDFSNILDNMTVMSICEDIYFDVTFYDTIDNENLKVEQVRYGEDATAPSTRTHAGYTFGGWNRGYSNVTSDITVNAVYSQNPVAATMYTVTFVDGDTNETIATQSVRSGLSATLPVVPEHQNRLFDYWEGDYTNVTSNRVVTAIYKNADVYSVRFLNGSHGFLNTDKLEVAYSVFDNNTFKEGNVVAPVVNPELGYHFTGWDYDFNDDTVVTEDIVITAKYELNTDVSYKVRYEYENGKEAAPEELVENKTFNETYEETAKEITGYTPDATKKSIKLDAYDKTLVFVYSANKDVSYTVKYQTTDGKDLADSVLVENKTFNETYEETAKEITGYTPDAAKKSIKLDAYDKTLVFVYNANKDVSYMVRYELKDGTKIAADTIVDDQIFGSTITQKPLDITGYTPDATSKKMVLDAYDKEMVFIYTPNKDVSYTVKYQTKDGKDLADSVLVENKTFNGTYEEKAKDITGYTPDSAKKSITLDAYNKELIFVYTAKEDVSYTVKYQTKDGKDLADSVLVENKTFDETYEETAKNITGYTPDSAKKSITLDAYNKELIFVYTANTNVSYTVKYQTKDGKDLADSVLVENKTFNETYEEKAKDITGYTPDAVKKSIKLDKYGKELIFVYTAKKDVSYTVKYQTANGKDLADSVLVENKTFNETYEETAKDITGYTPDATKKSIKLDKYGKELIFVYTAKKDVSYTVKYQTKDGKDLADSVLVENKTFNETYEETAKDITGYTVDAAKKSIKLDKYGKELIFVYTAKKDVSYTVKYQTKDGKDLADSVLVENKTFNETYEETAKDITGYTPDAAKKSIKLDKYGKDLIFVYTAKKDVSYTVKYQTANGKDLADSVLVENKTFNETYEETAKDIIGYTPDSAKKSIKLDKYGKELIFVYTANTNVSYTVKYQTKDGKDLADSVLVENKTFNETYEETAKDITGYTVDAAKKSIKLDKYGKELIFVYTIKNDYSYKVYYKYAGTDTNVFDPKTVNDVTYNTKVTEKALSKDGYTVDKATQELTVDAEGLSITFNYTIRNDYSYKVYYKYAGTDTNVFDPKTVNDITYNTKVTETAPSKDGYTADKTTKELTVDAEGLSITFTYSIRKDYSYKVYYKYTDGKEAHPTKSVSGQTYNTTHVETAAKVTGYTPDKNTQSIVLDTNNKSITFTYTVNYYSLTINYFYPDGKTKIHDSYVDSHIAYDAEFSVESPNIPGYIPGNETISGKMGAGNRTIDVIYNGDPNTAYKIEHYKVVGSTATLIGQVENKKAATESTVKITDYKAPKGYKLDSNYTGTKLSGVVTADGKLVLKAYYVVDQFDYKVERYFLNETTNKYEKDTANYPDITQSADYGTVINYAATVIPGYSKPTVNPTSLTVSEVENNNIIKVYYVLGTPNIVFDIKANITRDGSPVDGTARYNDIITYTLKLTNSGDANGNINVKDLLFALAKTNGDVQITEYLGSTTEADINNLLSENGLDLVVEYGTDKEVVISFKAKVVAKPGTVIESQVIYGPEETDKLDLKRFEVESTVEIEANRESGANIALILDLSNSMNQGTKLQDMKTSATNFINKVLPASGKNPYTRICLIFMPMKNGSTTATEQKCSNNASELISEINKLNENNVTGWTPYKSGLKTAAQSINNMINKGEDCRRWRFTETCSSYPYKYNSSHVVFFTDGLPVTSRDYYDRIIIDNDYIKQAGYIRNNATLYTIGFELDDTAYNRLTAIASSGNSYRASSSTINSVFDKIYNKIKDKVTKDTQSGKVTIISNNIDKTKNVTFTVNGVDEVLSYNNAVSKGYLDESSTPIKVVASKFAAGSTIKFSYYETKIAAKEITIDNGWSSGATSGVSGYNLQNEDELEVSGTAENFKLGSDANISSSLVSPSMITEEPQTNNDNTGNEEVTNNVTSEPVVNSATEPQEENTPENNQPTQNNVVDNSTNNVSDVKPEEDRLESNDTVATEDNNTPNENNIDNNETINDDSIVNENPTNDEEGNTPNEDAPVVKDEIITIKEEVKVEVKSVEVEEEKEPEEENTNEPKEDTLNEVPTVE